MDNIIVENLKFSYSHEVQVLNSINLKFDNKSTAIIGENGAGKTTFVKLLKGLLKPTYGTIYIKGKDTSKTTVATLAKDIGLVFQNPDDQIFKNKVIDEVMFGALNIGMDSETVRAKSLEILKLLGLENKIEENPYDLSLSERKLISIASVVAMDTEIIIFDEPTIAQDYLGREKIKNLIEKLRNQGKLVVTIIHDMDFVAENFERTILLNEGKVIIDSSTREVFSNTQLVKSAGLDLPYVTELGNKLGCNKTILTEEEFIDYYNKR